MQTINNFSPLLSFRKPETTDKIYAPIFVSLFALTGTVIWQYNPGVDKQGQLVRIIGLITISAPVLAGMGLLWDIYVNNKLPAWFRKNGNSEIETVNVNEETQQLNAKIGAVFGGILCCYDWYNGQDNLIPLIGYVVGGSILGVAAGTYWHDCNNDSTAQQKIETDQYLINALNIRRKAIVGSDNDDGETATWSVEDNK
jgi:hypothetical protein